MRAERERSAIPTVALAGYTNAGKSTLLNAITGAGVGVGDRLFHTLDPTTRSFEHDGRQLPADRHGRLHPQAAPPARRRLQGDARGDDPRRPDRPRRRRLRAAAERERRRCERSTRSSRRSAPASTPRIARLQQARPARRRRAPRPARRRARRGRRLRRDRRGDRGAARRDRGRLRARRCEPVELLIPYDEGAILNELHEVAGEVEREDRADGVLVRARVPRRLAHRFARYSRRRQVGRLSAVELHGPPARARGGAADPRQRRRRRPRPPRRRAGAARPGGAGLDRHRDRGRDPAPATPASSCRARAWRSGTGSRWSTRPGLIDSGYRGELRVLLLNTDREHEFEIEPGDRIAQLLIVPFAALDAGRGRRAGARRGAAATRGFGSQRRRVSRARPAAGCPALGVGGVLEPVVERLELRARRPRGARAPGRSARRRARRSSAAAGRAGRCRSGCSRTTPSRPSLPLLPCPCSDPPERLAAGAEVGAAAVVLEPGEHAAARRRGRPRSTTLPISRGPGSRTVSQVGDPEALDPLVAELVGVAEQLVAAADGEHRGAVVDRGRDRVALGREHVLGDHPLVAVLAAADVDQVVRVGVEALAGPGRRVARSRSRATRSGAAGRGCCRGRRRCSSAPGRARAAAAQPSRRLQQHDDRVLVLDRARRAARRRRPRGRPRRASASSSASVKRSSAIE